MNEYFEKPYKEILNQVLSGNYDKDLMEQATKLTNGDVSKAEALYIVRVCKGIWKPNHSTYKNL